MLGVGPKTGIGPTRSHGNSWGGDSVAPSSLEIVDVADTTISLIFDLNSDDEDGTYMERSDDLGNTYSVVGTLLPEVEAFLDEDLVPGTYYYYRARTFRGGVSGTMPAISSAIIDNDVTNKVVVTFDQALRTSTVPTSTCFTLAGKTISNVEISGSALTLTVTVAYAIGDTATLVYTQPGTNPIRGLVGQVKAASFSQVVTNQIGVNPAVSSAAIANTTPTKIDITFDTDIDTGQVPAASCFAVAGKTASAVSISGAVVTVTFTPTFDYGITGITVAYTRPATNPLKNKNNGGRVQSFTGQAVTNNITEVVIIHDTNTVGWWVASDTATLTKATGTTEAVSRWNDKLGSGHDLIQGTGIKQPIWSATGILFDGSNDFMATAGFTLAQPTHMYMVVKMVSVTNADIISDGAGGNSGAVYELTSGSIQVNAGTWGVTEDFTPINGSFGIMRIQFNGTTSKARIGTSAYHTASSGTASMGGFTLGSGAGGGSPANIEVKEVILRKVLDGTTDDDNIYNYLKAKYSIA